MLCYFVVQGIKCSVRAVVQERSEKVLRSGGAAQVGLLRWPSYKVPAQVGLLRWGCSGGAAQMALLQGPCSGGAAQVGLLRLPSYKVPSQVGLRKWVRCQSASLKVAAQVGHNATPPHDPTL